MVRAEAIRCLPSLGEPGASALQDLLASTNPQNQIDAVRAWPLLPSETAGQGILLCLRHKDAIVQNEAASVLARMLADYKLSTSLLSDILKEEVVVKNPSLRTNVEAALNELQATTSASSNSLPE